MPKKSKKKDKKDKERRPSKTDSAAGEDAEGEEAPGPEPEPIPLERIRSHELFCLFARQASPDHAPHMSIHDMPLVLRVMGVLKPGVSDQDVHLFSEQVDLDASGNISLVEFESLLEAIDDQQADFVKKPKTPESQGFRKVESEARRAERVENKAAQAIKRGSLCPSMVLASPETPRFLHLVQEAQWNPARVQAIAAAFDVFDDDSSGLLSPEEAQAAFEALLQMGDEILEDDPDRPTTASEKVASQPQGENNPMISNMMRRRSMGVSRGSGLQGQHRDVVETAAKLAMDKLLAEQAVMEERLERANAGIEKLCEENEGCMDFQAFTDLLAELTMHDKNPSSFLKQLEDHAWTREDMRDLRTVFKLFDVDGSGALGVHEMVSCFKSLGMSPTFREVEMMVEDADTAGDGDGELNFYEFVNVASAGFLDEWQPEVQADGARAKPKIVDVVQKRQWGPQQLKDYKKLYESFDRDKDGIVTTEDVVECFKQTKGHVDDASMTEFIKELDSDGSGVVDFVEFLMLLSKSMDGDSGGEGGFVAGRQSILEVSAILASQTEDEDAADEAEFELKQLVIALDSIVSELHVRELMGGQNSVQEMVERASLRNSNRRRSSFDPVGEMNKDKPSCAERLCKCIQKVLQTAQATMIQEKLQQMIIDFSKPVPPKVVQTRTACRKNLHRWLRFQRNRLDSNRHDFHLRPETRQIEMARCGGPQRRGSLVQRPITGDAQSVCEDVTSALRARKMGLKAASLDPRTHALREMSIALTDQVSLEHHAKSDAEKAEEEELNSPGSTGSMWFKPTRQSRSSIKLQMEDDDDDEDDEKSYAERHGYEKDIMSDEKMADTASRSAAKKKLDQAALDIEAASRRNAETSKYRGHATDQHVRLRLDCNAWLPLNFKSVNGTSAVLMGDIADRGWRPGHKWLADECAPPQHISCHSKSNEWESRLRPVAASRRRLVDRQAVRRLDKGETILELPQRRKAALHDAEEVTKLLDASDRKNSLGFVLGGRHRELEYEQLSNLRDANFLARAADGGVLGKPQSVESQRSLGKKQSLGNLVLSQHDRTFLGFDQLSGLGSSLSSTTNSRAATADCFRDGLRSAQQGLRLKPLQAMLPFREETVVLQEESTWPELRRLELTDDDRRPDSGGSRPGSPEEIDQIIPTQTKISETSLRAADYVFMRKCWSNLVLPKRHPVVEKSFRNTFKLDLKSGRVNDAEMRAAMHVLPTITGSNDGMEPPVHAIDVSGNRLHGESISSMVKSFDLRMLTELDFSRNTNVFEGNSGATAARDLAGAMQQGQLELLKALRFDGVHIYTFQELGAALRHCKFLEVLCLADTQLGKSSQNDVQALAAAIPDLENLIQLDVSHNFLRAEGCEAIGMAMRYHQSVEELLVAGNAGGFNKTQGGTDNQVAQTKHPSGAFVPASEARKEALSKSGSQFHPMLLLIENLLGNSSLQLLDFSSCQINYMGAFVLEGVLLAHHTVKNLVLADNPLGSEGLECMIRYISQKPQLEYVDLSAVRKGEVLPGELVYYHRNPATKYDLDMSNPFDRAVFYRLLLWCWVMHSEADIQMTDVKYDGPKIQSYKPGKASTLAPQSAGSDHCSGKRLVRHTQVAPGDLDKECDMPRWEIPNSGRLQLVFRGLFGLDSPADGSEYIARVERLRRFPVNMRRFVTIAALFENSHTAEQDEMLICAIRNTVQLKFSQLKYLVAHASGDIVPRMVKELLQCLGQSDKTAVLDMIPSKDQRRMIHKEVQRWVFFNPSNASGHYWLDMTRATDHTVADNVVLLNFWQAYLAENILELPDMSQLGDRMNLRNTSLNKNTFVFKVGFQLAKFPSQQMFSFDYVNPLRPDLEEADMPDDMLDAMLAVLENSKCRAYDKVMALHLISHHLILCPEQMVQVLEAFPVRIKELATFDSLQAAVEELDAPRIEVFISLFSRVADRPTVCSPDVLYDLELFPPAAVQTIWKRLGRHTTFDIINCCQMVPSNLGNRYELDLFTYEGHTLMRMLLKLGVIEDGENMVNCYWTEVSYLSAKTLNQKEIKYDYLIPATWLKEVPQKGTLYVDYVSELAEYNLPDKRFQLGEKYLGWGNISKETLSGVFRHEQSAQAKKKKRKSQES